MTIPVNAAINAYNSVAKGFAGGAGQDASSVGGSNGGPSFMDFMQDSLQNAVATEYKGEQTSAAALVGKASANDVVVAVNQADITLQEMTAIRDKVVSAYEDILKMPI